MEIIQKCQAWVDDEKFIPKKFRSKSWTDEFVERIVRELEAEMIKQKFALQNDKIYLPTKYSIWISREDSLEFSGIKRELLTKELNKFVERCFRTLAIEYKDRKFVQIYASSDFQPGKIKVIHQWEENYSPEIWFNETSPTVKSDKIEDFSEDTIVTPRFKEDNLRETENDCETVVRRRPRKFYNLDIWRDGVKQNNVPVFQSEITIGRGSTSVNVDVPLKGDLAVSRHHAVLTYRTDEFLDLSVTGQNPVIIGNNKPIFTGQNTAVSLNENVQIGSYLLKLHR